MFESIRNWLPFFLMFFLFSLCTCFVSTAGAEPDNQWTDIPDSAKLLIDKAIPVKAQTKPSAARKLLVLVLNKRDGKPIKGHPSIPYANYAIKLMGDKTGAWETIFSNDSLALDPDYLQQFDAICFNNTNGVLTVDPRLRNGLLDFVYSGKGFIGIHAAGATFVQWPVYDQFPPFGDMLGGYENGGHPWKPQEWITIKIDDPEHPLNTAFKGQDFPISDEVFQFQAPYSREKLRVLLSIDTTKTDMNRNRRILPERLADGDLAISWIREYGSGRVFYSTLGHNNHINWNAPVLEHYLDGIQYALGDLKASAIPSAKLTPANCALEKHNWKYSLCANEPTLEGVATAINAAEKQDILSIGAQATVSWLNENSSKIREMLVNANIRLLTVSVDKINNDPDEMKKLFVACKKLGVATITGSADKNTLPLIEALCDEYKIRFALTVDNNNIKQAAKWVENSKNIGFCADPAIWSTGDIYKTLKLLNNRLMVVKVNKPDNKSTTDKLITALNSKNIHPLIIGLCVNSGISDNDLSDAVTYYNQLFVTLAQAKAGVK